MELLTASLREKLLMGKENVTETVLKHEAVQHNHKAIMVAPIWPTGPITVQLSTRVYLNL